jgi:cytochrome c-type biogenesis protein CcmH
MKSIVSRTPRWTSTTYLLTAIAVLTLALLTSFAVSAQGPSPTDDEVNKIAKKLYCPVCENTPLDVCPTEACRQWREQIRELLSEGRTEKEIIDYFAVTYGERATGDPRNKLQAYLVPALAILFGVILLVSALRMWSKPRASAPVSQKNEAKPVRQDEYIARVEEELKKRK